ncbi:MAG: N-acetylmuramoyl-L-alanine amidase [Chloroflexota bacterium]|nr:N-acetylmuramoyl-L-alanine amidase [Chloroflexota bacterium]
MPSYPRSFFHRPTVTRRQGRWLAAALALTILGAACAMPGMDAEPRAPATLPVSGAATADEAGPAGSPSLATGAVEAPAVAARHEDDAITADPEIDPSAASDGAAPGAPVAPGQPIVVPPVAVPPVVIPPAPAPSGPGAACEPLPGPRAASWRDPLPPTARYNPEGPKRVGLQAGHWLTEQVPAELRGLGHGAAGGGKMEWEVNLDIALRIKALLEAQGIEVDILPTTVPVRYRAHLFVSIHADGDATGRNSGFKIARPAFSSLPAIDDQLLGALYDAYGAATGLRRDDQNITPRMRYYYAFNARRYCHAVAPGVPQAIVETGFLTNAADRQLLLGNPDVVARGITDGILRFLRDNP